LWLIGDAKIAKAGEIANEEEEKKKEGLQAPLEV